MKKLLFFIFCAITSLASYSQITFEEGYFITNEASEKTPVLIKFREWSDTPSEIEYKTAPEGQVLKAGLSDIKEFGVGDSYKFVREKVEIDRSEDNFDEVSNSRNPVLKEETLFLRTLLEGDYSLLYYHKGDLQRFFIRKQEGGIEQLIYKKYSAGNNIIKKNSRYRQQLLNYLDCKDISVDDLKNLAYTRSNLMKIFEKYYDCKGLNYYVYYTSPKGELNVMLKAGVNFTNFGMEQEAYNVVDDFQYQIDPRVGVEIEYILPFFYNKIAIYMEPSYSYYSAKEDVIIATGYPIPSNPNALGGYDAEINMKYQLIDLPLGLRYYMFLNKNATAKLFVNAGASLNLLFDSSTILNHSNDEVSDFDLNQLWQPTFFGGVGYRQNEKFSLELRYFPVRPLSEDGEYSLNQNHSFALVAGYTVF